MKVSIIAAMGQDYAIGKDNDLLWHLPKDMKYFMETTQGHHILMGRLNYLSIPEKFRPFKNRVNIVISRNETFTAEACEVFKSIEEGIAWAEAQGEEELFIIGGGMIYKACLEMGVVDEMYLTFVNAKFPDAHTHFPKFDLKEWRVEDMWSQEVDEKHPYSFNVKKLIKI